MAELGDAIDLAEAYTRTLARISAAACAEDHDPRWSDADRAALDASYAELAETSRRLAAALAALERDHATEWRAFLATSIRRLAALSRRDENGRIQAEYEHDRWSQWSRGELPVNDQPEIFARGVRALAENATAIDALLGV